MRKTYTDDDKLRNKHKQSETIKHFLKTLETNYSSQEKTSRPSLISGTVGV